jgi:hypothetical protein
VTSYLIPVYVLGFLLLVLATFALLARLRGGRYARPVVQAIAKVPLLKRMLEKASRAALERQNPALASAIKKLERSGAHRDPMKARAALSQLSAEERRAYLEAAGAQGAFEQQTVNRELRRRQARMQRGGGKRRR